MTTQKDLLAKVLAELADMKRMVARVDGYVTELRNSEGLHRQQEHDRRSRPATLTVNEDHDCWEFAPTSIHLDREDRLLIGGGIHFCIRGTDVPMDMDDPTGEVFCWIIWEFNRSRSKCLCVYAVFHDNKDGFEDDLSRAYIYEGPIGPEFIREDAD